MEISVPQVQSDLALLCDLTSSDWQSVAKVVTAYTEIGRGKELLESISLCVLNNSKNLDHTVRNSLCHSLETLVSADSDLILVLRNR